MPTLHVRNIPENLHERIKTLAATESHSLSAEVIALLDKAVTDKEMRLGQEKVLSAIRRRRFAPPAGSPESLDLLREDRNR